MNPLRAVIGLIMLIIFLVLLIIFIPVFLAFLIVLILAGLVIGIFVRIASIGRKHEAPKKSGKERIVDAEYEEK